MMELVEVRMLTGDLGKNFRWWRDVMGLEVTFGEESDAYAVLRANRDAVWLSLFDRVQMTEVANGQSVGPVVLSFQVQDVDDTVALLQSRGATLVVDATDRPSWGGLRTAHLRDPEGNLIEIHCKKSGGAA